MVIKVCLAANSGGHLNQLLQLEPFASRYNYFFITDRSQFSEGLSHRNNIFFVEKFIIKECIKRRYFFGPLRNLWQSFSIIKREQPDIIITTGAGTAFGSCLAGKLLGKKVIFIESIARVGEPSTFGRIMKFIASTTFVQWEAMLNYYKTATYSGIIFDLNKTVLDNQRNNRIFVTTGTYELAFDRILMELDRLKKKKRLVQEVIAQSGKSTYRPRYFETFEFAPQAEIHRLIELSDIVICHGGSGSIMDSLLRGKKVIAVPRLREFGEFFDNHQLQVVRELEKRNLIIAVYDILDLENAIERVESFHPRIEDIPNRVEELLNQFIAENLNAKMKWYL